MRGRCGVSFGLLSPRVDFVFKRIFGNEQHPNVLISFFYAVLNSDIEKEHVEDKYIC